jgi:hypothetical protein
MHGGSVKAESELGKGSTLTIRIPIDELTVRGVNPLDPKVSESIIRELPSDPA